LLGKREVFGVAQLKAQVGESARRAHLFGNRERSGGEIEAHDLATSLRERGGNVAGTGCDIQDARPGLGLNGLNESREAIWVRDERTRGISLRLLREFLAHNGFVIW